MPLWCWRYCSGHVGAALWRRGREPSRQTGRPDSRWKSGAGAASIARGWRRPGAEAQLRDTRVWRSCGGRCTRVGTDAPCRSIDGRRGRIDRIRQAPDRGRGGHRIRQAVASRDFWNVRGARGDTADVLHRSRDCRGVRGGGGGQGGIPAVRSTNTVTATPSAPNKRPAAHVESDTPRSPQATAGQLHRGALRSNAGPNRLRRKTADRPAKLIRTPARAA